MDYYGIPHAETHMKPLAFLVDIPFATAAVPGDGEAEVVFTLTHDVGRYIAALLDVPADQWPRDVICEGSRMSTNQLIALMERITGKKTIVTLPRIISSWRLIRSPPLFPLHRHKVRREI